ncbi:hypothetical protein BV497_01515 [Fulvimonas soli]|uniref:Putative secreted protein with PEP-CTERM sorting signal n=2 Tax=Fulvimonas soli TaxID=155197 RepID=A0A316IHA3_9GAMM|nr:hypothetical protein [Fulvimonas soli]PWK92509.1 putative secreted protein with PEP-CTERM sorting signal [Fulvimonas soli]TNY27723.1 hypothetical protein BV497_01515 [Fulvimonas soli]
MIPMTLLLLMLAALMALAVKRVPAGQVYSVQRHGRTRLLQPGVHLVAPGLDRIGHRIDLSGQVLRFREPLPSERDVCGTVYWQVLEPERADAVLDEVEQLIRRGALDALKAEPDVAHSDRRDLGSRLKQRLNGALRERGMMVTRVELEFA